jgi:hypothetical protein
MGRLRWIVLSLLLAVSPLAAQPTRAPTENVTVTGTKSREVLDKFVGSLASPGRFTGKMARWGSGGICPVTVGVPPAFVRFVNRRLKEIATQAGAPLNDHASCRPNIAIVFTPKPQTLADDILKRQPALLGYADNREQEKKLATITHPIQAWYMTATRDLHGNIDVDSSRVGGTGLEIPYECPPPGIGICVLHLSSAKAVNTTGSRLGDGLRSELYNVIIIADPKRLADYEMGSLADYIAMLALTEPASLDRCRDLSSILNLLAENCAAKASALTDNDAAFLHGLYKMSPDQSLGTQKDEVAYHMEQELKGH